MPKKRDYEEIKARVDALVMKTKAKAITPEEKIEIEVMKRHQKRVLA